MVRMLEIKHTDEQLEQLLALAPPPEAVTARDALAAVRRSIDRWSDERLLGIENLGSLMELEEVVRHRVPVALHEILYVRRTTEVRTAPHAGEEAADPARRPESLFHLPFKPPSGFADGEEPSFEAEGLRRVEACEPCGGRGEVRCGRCDGEGARRCRACDGTGRQPEEDGAGAGDGDGDGAASCEACGGSGTTGCDRCGGSGRLTCEPCAGTGKVVRRTIVTTEYRARRRADVHARGLVPHRKLASPVVSGELVVRAPAFRLHGAGDEELQAWRQSAVTGAYHAYARRVAEALVERQGEERRLFTLVVGVQLVPVVEVRFTYNERGHRLYLYGKEEHVHPASVPSSAAELVRSAYNRIRGLFSKREDPETTAEVFLEACIWICWADGYIHRKELAVLYQIVRESGLPLEKQQGLSERLELPPLGFELRGRLPDREDRRRCAKLCWQLVLADAVVEPVEEETFAQLVQQLELSPEEVEAVKREAATELVLGS